MLERNLYDLNELVLKSSMFIVVEGLLSMFKLYDIDAFILDIKNDKVIGIKEIIYDKDSPFVDLVGSPVPSNLEENIREILAGDFLEKLISTFISAKIDIGKDNKKYNIDEFPNKVTKSELEELSIDIRDSINKLIMEKETFTVPLKELLLNESL